MLYFNLNPVFAARQITKPYTFMVSIGIAPNTAAKISKNDMHVLRLSHIELLCRELNCQPNDLLAFKDNPQKPLTANHPLLKLTPQPINNNWQQKLKTLPLEKLKQISEIIAQQEI